MHQSLYFQFRGWNMKLKSDVFFFVFSCDNLQELILTDNKLRQLPTSIGNLKRMYHFNVDKNLLEIIPSDLGKLTALSVLSMRDNKLVRLPNEIGNLKEMTVLDVAENRSVIKCCFQLTSRLVLWSHRYLSYKCFSVGIQSQQVGLLPHDTIVSTLALV